MANMLSVVSWYVYPFNATYCASKAAALAVTEAARMELHRQGTLVVGVYAGFLDTDMAANVSGTKTPPRQVAERTLGGIRQGQHHVYADDHAVHRARGDRMSNRQSRARKRPPDTRRGAFP